MIESAILKKRIIFDNSLNEIKESICMLADLPSCCNRQLANMRGIVEELAGTNRKVMKFTCKDYA